MTYTATILQCSSKSARLHHHWFWSTLVVDHIASEAANLALKMFATGGLYLAGGIPQPMLSILRKPRFMQAFSRKGRFVELMERMPIHVILTRVALVGAATYGLERLEEESSGVAG